MPAPTVPTPTTVDVAVLVDQLDQWAAEADQRRDAELVRYQPRTAAHAEGAACAYRRVLSLILAEVGR